jgi:uncharacterized protein (DUF1330 family)
VVTREKTRDAAELERSKQLAPPGFKEHPAIIRAIHGRTEVLEGSAVEDIVILEFPTYEDAKAWYHGVVSRLGIASGVEASPPGRGLPVHLDGRHVSALIWVP